jgi:hypothetical protein
MRNDRDVGRPLLKTRLLYCRRRRRLQVGRLQDQQCGPRDFDLAGDAVEWEEGGMAFTEGVVAPLDSDSALVECGIFRRLARLGFFEC